MQPLLPLSIYQQVMQVYNLPLAICDVLYFIDLCASGRQSIKLFIEALGGEDACVKINR